MAVHLRRVIDRSLEWIEKFIKLLIGVVLGVMIVVNVMEVVSRYVGGKSIYWVHELTLLLVSWLTFLGIGVVYKQRTDAAVEMFVDLFGRRVKRAILLAVTPVVVAFLVIFIWRAFLYLSFQTYPTPALGIPTSLFSMPVIVGLALIVLCLIRDTLVPPQEAGPSLPPSCAGTVVTNDSGSRQASE